MLTHSQNLHDDQARSFTDTTLAKVGRQLDDLAATLARGKTRRTREQVTTEIETITHNPWVHAVIDWDLTGDTPAERRLTWTINTTKRKALENNVFGKRILITDHDALARRRRRRRLPLPIRNRIRLPATQRPPRGRRSPRCTTGPTTTSPSTPSPASWPCNWPTCCASKPTAPATTCPSEALLDTLGGIGETVLIYPSTGGRPKARRITTDMSTDQQALHDLFHLNRWAARTTT